MSNQTNPSYRDEDYEGYVAAGLSAGIPVPPLSDEDIRLLEEAWNNPRAYELSKDEGFVGAGWVPKPTDAHRGFPATNITPVGRNGRSVHDTEKPHVLESLLSGPKAYWEIRRYLYHVAESDLSASVTGDVLTHLTEEGLVARAVDFGRFQLTDYGRIVASCSRACA